MPPQNRSLVKRVAAERAEAGDLQEYLKDFAKSTVEEFPGAKEEVEAAMNSSLPPEDILNSLAKLSADRHKTLQTLFADFVPEELSEWDLSHVGIRPNPRLIDRVISLEVHGVNLASLSDGLIGIAGGVYYGRNSWFTDGEMPTSLRSLVAIGLVVGGAAVIFAGQPETAANS